MIPDEMKEIFEEFVVEAREQLENLENDMLELEKDPENEELLNRAFRSMHTLKGGAGFLGLTPIVEVAHKAEDLLGLMRNGELKLTPHINDIIFKAIDFIKEALNKYEEGEDVEIPEDLINELLKAKEQKEEAPQKEEGSSLEQLLDKYGFSHLKGKPIEEILEELILLPPDKRPEELITELDKLISSSPQSKEEAEKKDEEASQKMIEQVATVEEAKDEPKEEKEEIKEEAKEIEKPKDKKEIDKPKEKDKDKEKQEQQVEKVLRIDVKKIEDLMNLVGELVLDRNRLLRIASNLIQEYQSKYTDELEAVLSSIDRIVGDLQIAVMKTRMQPVKRLFQKFPRVVRDISKMLGKEVELIMEGEDTELDKSILEKLEEPLIHIIRNSIDHGIEPPEERIRLGKPRKGIIKLKAYYQGDRIFIVVEDDGRGIDIEKVKKKALEKGLVTEDKLEKMSEKELLFLIFNPGFSTAERVSEVSGRGVGMDVVANTVSSFRGTIDVESVRGKGTKIMMSFPLTIGIIRSIMVRIKDRIFAIPIYSVLEILPGESTEITTVSGREVLIVRDMTIPLINLSELLGIGESEVGYAIVAWVGNQRVAFTVEDLLGDEEIVVKPLGKLFGDIEGISGATITGDGKVVLILDLDGLLKREIRSINV